MSQIPPIASIESINKQLWVITARIKVLTQYAALSVADKDIYILLEDIYEAIKKIKHDDYDAFANLKADFMVLNYYESEVLNPDFDNSMFSLSQKFEELEKALSDRLEFEATVSKLQKVGVA
jgi:beta-glucosidase/6-phospho-beta-glucosidase/beta-galactosidase